MTCIADTHQDRIGLSLCGRTIGWAKLVWIDDDPHLSPRQLKELVPAEWCFTGLDHWFCNARNQGNPTGCGACLGVVLAMLRGELGGGE